MLPCALLAYHHTHIQASSAEPLMCAAAAQDYSKALQFQKLNALKDIIEIKVTRDGKQVRDEMFTKCRVSMCCCIRTSVLFSVQDLLRQGHTLLCLCKRLHTPSAQVAFVALHCLQLTVENTEVVVGDVLLLDTGDKLIADGIAFESLGLVIDEASLTGEVG